MNTCLKRLKLDSSSRAKATRVQTGGLFYGRAYLGLVHAGNL